MDCYSCKSLTGEARISPGPPIFTGDYWVVEHAYPVGLPGWLVIVLKRHAEAAHELSSDEFAELAGLQERCAKALHEALGCEKEYLVCFAEAEHFKHVHVHVIPRATGAAPDKQGVGVFSYLKVKPEEAVPPSEVREMCERLQHYFS